MGDLIDFHKARATLRARAKRYVKDVARDERELVKQDILLVLSCDPFASVRSISEQLWEDFNEVGSRLVREMLRELEGEGLILFRKGSGWHLSEAAEEALYEIFDTEESDD